MTEDNGMSNDENAGSLKTSGRAEVDGAQAGVAATSKAGRGAAASEVRRPAARVEAVGRRLKLPIWPLAVLAFAAGGILVGLFVHHRDNTGHPVVAVNGAVIDRGSFYYRLEKIGGPAVIRQMVLDELQLQYAQKKGIAPTDAQVNARYKELSRVPHFEENLERSGLTPEDVKRDLRLSLTKIAVLNQGVTVTDAEVRKYYRANIDSRNPTARFYSPEAVQIQVIVTNTAEEAQKAFTALSSGAKFALVARDQSIDPSKSNGGVLPPILRGRTPAKQVAGLEDTIFGMSIGQVLGPREFAGTWWIIKCLDLKPAAVQPFQKVEDQARTGAMLMKGIPANGKKVDADFRAFVKASNIQAFWPQYSQAVAVDQ